MANVDKVLSENSDSGVVHTNNKNRDNQISSYFVSKLDVSSRKKSDNPSVNDRYFNDGASTSGRKVNVNVTSHGVGKVTEISVSSKFPKKSVDRGTQPSRNIAGQEESPPKERKKCVRPPVVGQASNIDARVSTQSQHVSDSEVEEKKTRELHLSIGKTSYINEDILDLQNKEDSENHESLRVASPGSVSSLSSHRLEWDNGADVGYHSPNDAKDQRISTIEKLALGSSSIFQRSDPEGTTGNSLPNQAIKIAPPVAESTLKIDYVSESDSDTNIKQDNIIPEVIVKNIGVLSDSSTSPDLPRRTRENIKEISASLEEIKLDDNQQAILRTLSQNNIAEENTKPQRVDSAKSRSSSSVSTVVNKKNSQCSSYRSKQFEPYSDGNNERLEAQQEILSRQLSPQVTDQFSTLDSNQLTGEARVNSFEFLPGHIYENSVNKVNSNSSSLHEDIWQDSGSRSLKDDVERGACLLSKFIRSSKAGNDESLKKQFVRRVMEKLINSDYYDDDSVKSEGDKVIETRRQISGESSTEESCKAASDDSPPKFNKCVGTGMSTSLSGYTESSEWNTDSNVQKSSFDSYPSHYSGRQNERADKIIQTSLRESSNIKQSSMSSKHETKSKLNKKSRRHDEKEVLTYLQKERKNQLFWIKSEIDHLSNLKLLLEKHENLKKNLECLKRNRHNLERPLKQHLDLSNRSKMMRDNVEKKLISRYKSDQRKTKSNSSSSSDQKETGWTSHHYVTDDDMKVRKENIEPASVGNRQIDSTEQQLPRSTSYTIIFPDKSEMNLMRKTKEIGPEDDVMLSVGELKLAINKIVERHGKPAVVPDNNQPTLREYLENVRPDYIKNAEGRRQILSEIVELRQHRQSNKQEIIAAVHADQPGPPPPLAVKRVFSQKNLRKQTEMKYKQLADVRVKKAEIRRKEQYKTNRLMAEVFNRRLQRRALQGQVNLSNSVCVTDPIK